MAPCDMLLNIGTIVGYDKKIVIAGPDKHLGLNESVKSSPVDIQNDQSSLVEIQSDISSPETEDTTEDRQKKSSTGTRRYKDKYNNRLVV